MWDRESIYTVIMPTITTLGYELVGIECHVNHKNSLLRVYIDSDLGITVDDCENISHQVSALLDVEKPNMGSYTLEVSSPGLDRPLFTKAHYVRFIANDISITLYESLDGQKKLKGLLKAVLEDEIVIVVTGKDFQIPLSNIKKARLVPKIN
ncbi:ribosome maturation factor RimP [Candidatus Nitrosacidococcus sp. I8]|uniref:ribosome maturation factor RimP n=1 Tax=Candidatus Nitrosacidococcus sp. I8 TaxID=2942908 RepID=UPI002227CD20|nr:ribosome maturation factor RimP [Candidatus Nitrosacidococcus sp. I8]CAH9017837.1 Ribosome maturation factor RimP [Candidatus Nitrosacidococcus sp. I8]